jgi:hypothetical protein
VLTGKPRKWDRHSPRLDDEIRLAQVYRRASAFWRRSPTRWSEHEITGRLSNEP